MWVDRLMIMRIKKFWDLVKRYLHLSKNEVYGDNKANSILEERAVSQKQSAMKNVSRNHNHYNY